MKEKDFIELITHHFNFVYDRTKDTRLQKQVINTCLDIIGLYYFYGILTTDYKKLDEQIKSLKQLNNQQ